MSDIVARLRRYYPSNPEKENDLYRAIREAADEIERLRKENEVLKAADYEALRGGVTGKDKDMLIAGFQRDLAKAAAEIERLRNVEADHKQLLERLRALLAE